MGGSVGAGVHRNTLKIRTQCGYGWAPKNSGCLCTLLNSKWPPFNRLGQTNVSVLKSEAYPLRSTELSFLLLYLPLKISILKFVLNKNMSSLHWRTNSKRNILNKYLLFCNNAWLIVTTTITISVTHHLNVVAFCDWHFGLFRFRNDNF